MLKKTTSAKGLDTEARRAWENVLTVIAKDTAYRISSIPDSTVCGMISLRYTTT